METASLKIPSFPKVIFHFLQGSACLHVVQMFRIWTLILFFCETKNLDNDLMDLSKVMEIKNLQPLEDDYISNGYPVSFFKNLIDVEQISIDFKESFLKKDIHLLFLSLVNTWFSFITFHI